MQRLTLVTGNKHKLTEWRRLVSDSFELEAISLELDELQSLDLEAVASDKARRAYEQIKRPVVVEDIAAGLVKLKGLPGPFIKFFEDELGKGALFQLAGHEGEEAITTCVLAYYDGQNTITVRADVEGTVLSPRGDYGFGFDFCFAPKGHTQTYAEMGPTAKDKVSHRAVAIKTLLAKLLEL